MSGRTLWTTERSSLSALAISAPRSLGVILTITCSVVSAGIARDAHFPVEGAPCRRAAASPPIARILLGRLGMMLRLGPT